MYCRIFVFVTLVTTALMIHTALRLLTVYEVHAYVVSNPQNHSLICYVVLG